MPPDRFQGTTPDPVSAGGSLNIDFTNKDLAGTTVTVRISNGDGVHASVDIQLDAHGRGSAAWEVPATGWDGVILSHATSEDHTIIVN